METHNFPIFYSGKISQIALNITIRHIYTAIIDSMWWWFEFIAFTRNILWARNLCLILFMTFSLTWFVNIIFFLLIKHWRCDGSIDYNCQNQHNQFGIHFDIGKELNWNLLCFFIFGQMTRRNVHGVNLMISRWRRRISYWRRLLKMKTNYPYLPHFA